MQDRYWSIVVLQSEVGSVAFEKSMHSSRLDFSSLQTQQGLGFVTARESLPELTAVLASGGVEEIQGIEIPSQAILIDLRD